MARNRYFNQYGTASEQNVYEDLIIESIKIYGTGDRLKARAVDLLTA